MNCAQALGIAAATFVMVAGEPLSTHFALARTHFAAVTARGEAMGYGFMAEAKAQARCAFEAQRAGSPRL